jgi:lipopolysaccharide export system permease protein
VISLFDRYIGRAVLFSILSVLLLLLVLLGFFDVVSELDEVERGYTSSMAYLYVLLTLPRYTYELFPIASLLGSLIGLGALAGNSELMAMRAAGVSIGRIVLSALKAGLILLLLVVVVGEYLAPHAEQAAQRMKTEALSAQIALKTRYGFWSREGDTFINIRQILPGRVMADVYIYEYDNAQHLLSSTHADRAYYRDGGWWLESVRRSEFTPAGVQVSSQQHEAWQTHLEPAVLDVMSVKPQMLAAWDLWRYIGFLKQNGQAATSFEIAFWGKLAAPLVTLVMVFLSVPFVFGSLRSVGIGQRIFAGAMLGIVFYVMNRAFSYLAVVYAFNALFASLFPVLLFFSYALWKFRGINQ